MLIAVATGITVQSHSIVVAYITETKEGGMGRGGGEGRRKWGEGGGTVNDPLKCSLTDHVLDKQVFKDLSVLVRYYTEWRLGLDLLDRS